MITDTWNGTYEDSWKGYIVDAAFSHPAKFARGLIERILRYMRDENMLMLGDTIVDPFGGIGCGGIIAAGLYLQWIGCELEPKFVKLAEENFALHRRTWEKFGDPLPVIVCGDSRKLRENLRGVLVDAAVSSPPYSQSLKGDKSSDGQAAPRGKYTCWGSNADRSRSADGYGESLGQLGSMPPGTVDSVVSSPPYSESLRGDNTAKETAEESRAKRVTEGGSLGQSCRHAGYGSAENLGNMPAGSVDGVVSSPPFQENNVNIGAVGDTPGMRQQIHNSRKRDASYGSTAGQLGQMPAGNVDGVVSKVEGNTTPDTIDGKETFHDRKTEASRDTVPFRSRDAADSRSDRSHKVGGASDAKARGRQSEAGIVKPEMELSETGDRIPLRDDEPGEHSGVLRCAPKSNSDCDEKIGDTVEGEGQARDGASSIQTRQVERYLQEHDNQGQVPEVRNDGESWDSPQERRPLRQPIREPGNSLQPVPHERDETQVVGGKESRSAVSEEHGAGRVEPKADSIVSSPPYEGSHVGADDNPYANSNGKSMGEARAAHLVGSQNYGGDGRQLGNSSCETFWSAARDIVLECHAILKPGGWSAWVVKDFIRDKQRVPFCDDWCRLLESCGFRVERRIRAMLVKEQRHADLFGGEQVKTTARKSFFRRLYERKYPENSIDFEEVVFARRSV